MNFSNDMNFSKACHILGIDKSNSSEITIELLKKKYKLKALQYHPDKNDSPDASEKFQEINNSYHYLLENLDYIESDDDEDDNDNDNSEQINKTGYRWVLYKFLKNILSVSNEKTIFYKIIEKISTTCEKKSLEILENIDKQKLIKLYEILSCYKEAFHFTNDFFEKVELIIKKKVEGDECVILHPTIEDLFENNLYKLKINELVYIIPLWHHELIYDNCGNDLYVKCYPILDHHIRIDEKNNIHIELSMKLNEIWGKHKIDFIIGNKSFHIFSKQIKLLQYQQIILFNEGISKINTNDIYNIDVKGDIIVYLRII